AAQHSGQPRWHSLGVNQKVLTFCCCTQSRTVPPRRSSGIVPCTDRAISPGALHSHVAWRHDENPNQSRGFWHGQRRSKRAPDRDRGSPTSHLGNWPPFLPLILSLHQHSSLIEQLA